MIVLYIFLLLSHHRLLPTFSSTAEPPEPLLSDFCTGESFSSCVQFIGTNSSTDFPPQHCCDDISAAFREGSAVCMCRRQLNQDKFTSLPMLGRRRSKHNVVRFLFRCLGTSYSSRSAR